MPRTWRAYSVDGRGASDRESLSATPSIQKTKVDAIGRAVQLDHDVMLVRHRGFAVSFDKSRARRCGHVIAADILQAVQVINLTGGFDVAVPAWAMLKPCISTG